MKPRNMRPDTLVNLLLWLIPIGLCLVASVLGLVLKCSNP